MDQNDVKRAVVAGAGVMGHPIAHVFAQAGIEVNLVDLNQAVLERAMGLIHANLETLAEFERISKRRYPGGGRPHSSLYRSGRRGSVSPLVKEKVDAGDLGVKTSKGVYDYGGRSEAEIPKKRDRRYLKLLGYLEKVKAFERV